MITLNNTFVSYNSKWDKCEYSISVIDWAVNSNFPWIYVDQLWGPPRRVIFFELRLPIKITSEVRRWK